MCFSTSGARMQGVGPVLWKAVGKEVRAPLSTGRYYQVAGAPENSREPFPLVDWFRMCRHHSHRQSPIPPVMKMQMKVKVKVKGLLIFLGLMKMRTVYPY